MWLTGSGRLPALTMGLAHTHRGRAATGLSEEVVVGVVGGWA